MKEYVQIGTAALRSPTGEFLQAEPIYREVTKRSSKASEKSYIDEESLFDIFASKSVVGFDGDFVGSISVSRMLSINA